jgi:hypothetical protein
MPVEECSTWRLSRIYALVLYVSTCHVPSDTAVRSRLLVFHVGYLYSSHICRHLRHSHRLGRLRYISHLHCQRMQRYWSASACALCKKIRSYHFAYPFRGACWCFSGLALSDFALTGQTFAWPFCKDKGSLTAFATINGMSVGAFVSLFTPGIAQLGNVSSTYYYSYSS